MNMSGHKSSYTQEKLRNLFQPVDMTTGEPWRKILLFMVPMLIGNIAQQLYNTVDSIVVGKYLGDHALAAVGSAGPIVNLLIILYVGIGMGAGIVTAQYLGAGKKEALASSIGNCLILTVLSVLLVMAGLLSGLLTVLILAVGRPLAGLFTDTEELIVFCVRFIRILAAGYTMFAITQCLCGTMRGAGDAMATMWISVICSFLVRIPLAYALVSFSVSEQNPDGNADFMYYSQLAAWCFGTILAFVLYRKGKWHKGLERQTV